MGGLDDASGSDLVADSETESDRGNEATCNEAPCSETREDVPGSVAGLGPPEPSSSAALLPVQVSTAGEVVAKVMDVDDIEMDIEMDSDTVWKQRHRAGQRREKQPIEQQLSCPLRPLAPGRQSPSRLTQARQAEARRELELLGKSASWLANEIDESSTASVGKWLQNMLPFGGVRIGKKVGHWLAERRQQQHQFASCANDGNDSVHSGAARSES